MIKPSVYLCGPITGLSYDEARGGWRTHLRRLVDRDIDLLSPMRQENHLAEIKKISHDAYPENPVSTSRAIVAKDRLDIQRCDLVVANFLGAKQLSVGSIVECGWANALGKPIVFVIEKREKPEEASNVHDRFFLMELADFYVHDVKQAADIVNSLLMPGV